MTAEIKRKGQHWEIVFPRNGFAPMLALEWLAESDIETYLQYISSDLTHFHIVMDINEATMKEFKDYINANL